MKIGIITQPLRYNYGGILQNYALQQVLIKMGHDVCTINDPIYPDYSIVQWCVKILNRAIRKYILRQKIEVFYEHKRNKLFPIIGVKVIPFINKYIKYTNCFEPTKGTYDAFVVGSDQVWRSIYNDKRALDKSFLAFAEEWTSVKRVAYAASFGTDVWEYSISETEKTSRLIKKFNAVSVREQSGIGLCKEHWDVNAVHVLDPTMLLQSEDYINNLGIRNLKKSNGNLFCYLLDRTDLKCTLLNMLVAKGYDAYSVYEDNPNMFIDNINVPSIERWLRCFYDAELVLTDSFHGCAFSIIFNKPFVVIANEERGAARFMSLLNMINQEYRIVRNVSDFNDNKDRITQSPNADLSELRKKSIDYLRNNL